MRRLVPPAAAVACFALAWTTLPQGMQPHRSRQAASPSTHANLFVVPSAESQRPGCSISVPAPQALPAEDLALLTHVGAYPDRDARARVFERLLGGDEKLARSVLREASIVDPPDVRRIQLIPLLALSKDSTVQEWLRSMALGSDDNLAVLALAAILDSDTPSSDWSDRKSRDWGRLSLAELEKSLVEPGRRCVWRDPDHWEIPARGSRLAKAWGVARSPAVIEFVREVAAHGDSVEARTRALRAFPDDWDSLGLLLSIAQDQSSPPTVKTTAFECVPIGSVDFAVLAEGIQREKDPALLFVLCKHVAVSGQARASETCALLETLAPAALEDRDLSLILTHAVNQLDSAESVEALGRIAGSAPPGDLRDDALGALTVEVRQGYLANHRGEILRRLAYDEDPALSFAACSAIVYAGIQAREQPTGKGSFVIPLIDEALYQRAIDLLKKPGADFSSKLNLMRAFGAWREASSGAAPQNAAATR